MDKQKTILKNKFKYDFNLVQIFVNKFDFFGFIQSGAPIDEYNSLTNLLLSSIYAQKSKEEIIAMIFHEIQEYFGFANFKILEESEKINFDNELELLIEKIHTPNI